MFRIEACASSTNVQRNTRFYFGPFLPQFLPGCPIFERSVRKDGTRTRESWGHPRGTFY